MSLRLLTAVSLCADTTLAVFNIRGKEHFEHICQLSCKVLKY